MSKAWCILLGNAIQISKSPDLFSSKCFAGAQHSSTDVNYSLQICGIKIRITFTLAERMNQALLRGSKCLCFELTLQGLPGTVGLDYVKLWQSKLAPSSSEILLPSWVEQLQPWN